MIDDSFLGEEFVLVKLTNTPGDPIEPERLNGAHVVLIETWLHPDDTLFVQLTEEYKDQWGPRSFFVNENNLVLYETEQETL